MRYSLLIPVAFLCSPNSHAVPACASVVKEELARQKIPFESAVAEAQDSDKMVEEYEDIKDRIQKIEGEIPLGSRPEREDFKTYQAFDKAFAEYQAVLPEMREARAKLIEKKNPEYKSLKSALERLSEGVNEPFNVLAVHGGIAYGEILNFKKNGKVRVGAYVKNGRIEGFHAVQSEGDRDYVILDRDCKPELVFLKHGQLTDSIRDEICDELPRLKGLIEASEKNSLKVDESFKGLCEFQGGKVSEGHCRCEPGLGVKQPLFTVINPTNDSETCFEKPALNPAKELIRFADLKNSSVEPSSSSYKAIERACRVYFKLPAKAAIAPAGPGESHTQR